MKNSIKKETGLGFLFFTLFLLMKNILHIHHFWVGLFLGLSIGFYILGILPEEKRNKLANFKTKLFKRKCDK